jgi:alkylation response protein AidB-like acyl-CoA dehydrogenase
MNSITPRTDIRAAICDAAGDDRRHDGDLAPAIALLRSAGWLAACLPQAHGGEGWGTQPAGALDAFATLRELGRADLSVARVFEGHMNAVKLVMLYGCERLREELARQVHDGTLLGVWGADDPDDPIRIERAGDGLVLRGAKRFASGLRLVGSAVITAGDGDDLQMMLVPTRDDARADPTGWRMSGMSATQSGRYDFNGVKLQDHLLVGKPGDLLAEPWFEGGIWRYCAAHLGAAETLHSEMCKALSARDRHRDTNQQARIAQSAIAIETMRLWLRRCAIEVEAADAGPDKAALSLFAREVTANECRRIISLVEQSLGMAAFVEGSVIDAMRRDLSLFLCQARPDAKRAAAVDMLLARSTLVEEL